MPISQKRHAAEIAKVQTYSETIRRELVLDHQKDLARITEAVDAIVYNLSSIEWKGRPYGDFAVQVNMSADMLSRTVDVNQRKAIAESLGRRVAHEIEISKFLRP